MARAPRSKTKQSAPVRRFQPAIPDAQNTHPIAHPAWVLRHTVERPLKRISTVSIVFSSASRRRNLWVSPSLLKDV